VRCPPSAGDDEGMKQHKAGCSRLAQRVRSQLASDSRAVQQRVFSVDGLVGAAVGRLLSGLMQPGAASGAGGGDSTVTGQQQQQQEEEEAGSGFVPVYAAAAAVLTMQQLIRQAAGPQRQASSRQLPTAESPVAAQLLVLLPVRSTRPGPSTSAGLSTAFKAS
jgi:hypothetical protein